MKHLFIMGVPRSGTTVSRDLFANVLGLTVIKELPIKGMANIIAEGKTVVWKSPTECLKGEQLKKMFPDAIIVRIVRDGRQNLAAHKKYLETYKIDYLWGSYAGQGLKGFAKLWNDFAPLTLKSDIWFRLEDLVSDAGEIIVSELYKDCEYPNIDNALDFWKNFVYRQGIQQHFYPRAAVSLNTPPWQEILTDKEVSLIDPNILGRLGYV